jgi:anti-sigma regulatory factor (Ser/Thr protein kinase)
MTAHATLHLPPEATSPRAARRFVDDTLAEWACADASDVVALLASELVTNALLHARSEVDLRVSRTPDALLVEVVDHSPVPPSPKHYRPEAETGRGLALIEALAAAWGVRPTDNGGKTVWFEVRT